MAEYLGIDGCPAGWFVTWLDEHHEVSPSEQKGTTPQPKAGFHGVVSGAIFKSFAEVFAQHQDAKRVLIDIPIGLLKSQDRLIESEVRKRIGARRSSVFSVPCIDAVYAASYDEANGVNRQMLGKGLSKQAWFLCPKIQQANDFLTANVEKQLVMGESHPELAFATLNGAPLNHSKKTELGIEIRRELLSKKLPSLDEFIEQCLTKYRRRELVLDDCLDSLALLIAAINPTTLDAQMQVGVAGVPIQMWLPAYTPNSASA